MPASWMRNSTLGPATTRRRVPRGRWSRPENRNSPRCPRRDDPIHRSSGGGSSSWSGRAARRRRWADSSSPLRRRFATGCGGPIALPAAARTGHDRRAGGAPPPLAGEQAAPRGARNIKKAAAWFARETGSIPSRIRVRESAPGRGRTGRSQARGAADARGGPAGRESPEVGDHHAAGSRRATGT